MSAPAPCPRCGSADRVASVNNSPHGGYHCGLCNTVFAGTTEEFDQWTNRRRAFQSERDRLAKLDGGG